MSRHARRHRWCLAAALVPLLFVAACGGTDPDLNRADPEPPSPFADCAELAVPPALPAGTPPLAATVRPTGIAAPTGTTRPSEIAAPTGTTAPTETATDDPTRSARSARSRAMPAIRLPCFTGGETVALDSLRGPAVVNLWASWCQPCREELPAFQRLAQSTAGQLHVVGVDTRDRRESARSLAADLGLSFPNLVDRDERLRVELGRAALPVTLFIDGQGRIRHLDDSGALDDATLAGLVRRHLEVATAR